MKPLFNRKGESGYEEFSKPSYYIIVLIAIIGIFLFFVIKTAGFFDSLAATPPYFEEKLTMARLINTCFADESGEYLPGTIMIERFTNLTLIKCFDKRDLHLKVTLQADPTFTDFKKVLEPAPTSSPRPFKRYVLIKLSDDRIVPGTLEVEQ